MGGSSADIEALLVDVTDPGDPTPGMLPAIFRDIVGRLDATGLAYAVVGRIALTLHEQARFVGEIEIVADLGAELLVPIRGDRGDLRIDHVDARGLRVTLRLRLLQPACCIFQSGTTPPLCSIILSMTSG